MLALNAGLEGLFHPLTSVSSLYEVEGVLFPKLLIHNSTSTWAAIPAHVSRTTSRTVPVREGMKDWCHSSRLATRAVPRMAMLAQRTVHRRWFGAGKVARQARKRRMLSVP